MSKERDIFSEPFEQEAPVLNSIPKTNPFAVPEGYFEALPAQIIEKCRESHKRIPTFVTNKVFWLFRPQWLIASFIAIAGLCFFLRQGGYNNTVNYDALAASIPDSVIIQNLQNNIDNINISTLEEVAQNSNNIGALPQPATQDSANRQIINYLMNNNVDASDIENEL